MLRLLADVRSAALAASWWIFGAMLTCGSAGAGAQTPVEQVAPAPIDPGGQPGTGEEAEPSAPGLSGQWGGLRPRLQAGGVSITAGHVAQIAHNLSGGERSRTTLAGQLLLGADLDLQTLAGLSDTTARISFTYRHGAELGSRAGFTTLLPIQEIYGRGQIVRLTEAWIQRTFSGRLTVRAGRMPAADFATFTCDFQNLALCGSQPGHTVYDYWQTWPISQWGAWARYGSGDGPHVQIGGYQVTPANLDEDSVEFGSLTKATGILVPLEFSWAPRVGRRDLKGSYKVGGWLDTSDAVDALSQLRAISTSLSRRRERHGGYLSIVQEVFANGRNSERRSLAVFLNIAKADRRTAIIDFQLATGLLLHRPLASRPNDLVGLGYAKTRSNPRLAAYQMSTDPTSAQRSEHLLEMFYRAQVHPAVAVQPGLQYIGAPGGLRSRNAIVAPTFKVAIQF